MTAVAETQKDEAELVNLVFAASPVERTLVDRWLVAAERTGKRVDATDDRLAAWLADGDDDPVIAPIGVSWLPPERSGVRRASVVDLMMLANPRRPRVKSQERIARRHPERARVVEGAPARLSELRERFARVTGGAPDGAGFGAFVARQGQLALDRAERSITGDRYKVPRLVAEDIAASAPWRAMVQRLAETLEEPRDRVSAKADAALDEMVASQSRLAIDVWDEFTNWMARAYTLDVDERNLDHLRALGREHALIFLPSHRSYLDPMVLRHALAGRGFPPNHTLGGVNTAVWPIGPVARRSGLIFIPRTLRDAPVHKAVLREYVAYLLRKRFNLEWYIEGGRSRTGKLRSPRFGLLAYVIDAFKASPDREVYLVPASIVYDQLPEVGIMAAEDRGGTKKPESIKWLVNYARSQSRRMGRVHVTIGEPLGLGATLAEADSVPKVAFEICHRINRVTPVTPTSIVTMAMLGAEGRGLTLQEGREIVLPILEFLDGRKLPVTADVRLGDVGPLREALSALVGEGVVKEYPGGVESVYAIDPAKQPEAAFYRNASIHFFITRAIVELALLHAAETNADDLEDAVWQEALRLRDLLKFEFFFARKREFADEVRAEVEMMAPGWESRTTTAQEVEGYLRAQPLLLAPRVLRPFVEAYWVVADELARRTPPEPTDEKSFLADCVQVALQQHARGRLVAGDSVSKELFGGALRLAANRGLDDSESRHAFARETADVDRRLGVIAQMARRLIPDTDPAWATSND